MNSDEQKTDENTPKVEHTTAQANPAPVTPANIAVETGGPSGLEPTRYGDWERNGRCTDF